MNMSTIRTWSCALLLAVLFPLITHAQTCHWLRGATATNDDSLSASDAMQTRASATDAAGNIYIAGDFSLDTVLIGDTILVNYDSFSTNIFVAKYDSLGNVLWVRSFGGTQDDEAYGIAVDASGNVYVSGSMSSPLVYFDTITINNPTRGIFLVKLNSSGSVVWVRAGSSGNDLAVIGEGVFVTTDVSGNIILTGSFSDSLHFGTVAVYDTPAGYATSVFLDMFVARYSSAGDLVWLKGTTGGTVVSEAIATDSSGNIFVSGEYSFHAGFDTVHVLAGDNYVVKYNSAGDAIWAFSTNDKAFVWQAGLATDATGNIYATGSFAGDSIVFGSTTLTNASPPGSDAGDMFLVKFAPDGNIVWAQRAGGTGDEEPHAIVAKADGTTYIGGYFTSPSLTFGASTLSNPLYFIASYSSAGAALWAKGDDAFASASPVALSLDNFHHLYAAGGYASPLDLDGNSLTVPPNFSINAFLAQYNDIPAATSVRQFPATTATYSLYPNPATGSLYIDGSENIATVSITNLVGQTIYSGAYNDAHVAIDIATYPSGIYLVKINNAVVRKFVKE